MHHYTYYSISSSNSFMPYSISPSKSIVSSRCEAAAKIIQGALIRKGFRPRSNENNLFVQFATWLIIWSSYPSMLVNSTISYRKSSSLWWESWWFVNLCPIYFLSQIFLLYQAFLMRLKFYHRFSSLRKYVITEFLPEYACVFFFVILK